MSEKVFCSDCDKELSEEKGEWAHGCLNCHGSIQSDKLFWLRKELTAAQAEITRLREVLQSVDEFIARTPMLNQGELTVLVPRIRKSYKEALNKGGMDE